MTLQWHRVADAGDIPADRPIAGEAAGIALALVRVGDAIQAVEDRCPHMAYPLHHGVVRDGRLVCTWHHWEFDLAGGQRFANERARCTTYPVREEDGGVWVGIDPEDLPPAPGGFPRPELPADNA